MGVPLRRTFERQTRFEAYLGRSPPIRPWNVFNLPAQHGPVAPSPTKEPARRTASRTRGVGTAGRRQFPNEKASPSFRRLASPGTTRWQQHGPRVPSRGHRPESSSGSPAGDPGCLLERHSQGAAFETLGHHAEHRGPTRPPHALPALVMTFGHRVTWLAGVSPAHVRLMSGLPARHSFRVRRPDFREPKLEAFPYPQTKVLSPSRIALRRPATCSASSPDSLTGKPLSFGPFALELFAAGDLPRTPGPMKTRSRSSPSRELHAPATLNARRRDEPRGRD